MSEQDPLQDKLLVLDRLEELLEDMQELGVTSIDDIRERIEQLEREIDDPADEADDDGPV